MEDVALKILDTYEGLVSDHLVEYVGKEHEKLCSIAELFRDKFQEMHPPIVKEERSFPLTQAGGVNDLIKFAEWYAQHEHWTKDFYSDRPRLTLSDVIQEPFNFPIDAQMLSCVLPDGLLFKKTYKDLTADEAPSRVVEIREMDLSYTWFRDRALNYVFRTLPHERKKYLQIAGWGTFNDLLSYEDIVTSITEHKRIPSINDPPYVNLGGMVSGLNVEGDKNLLLYEPDIADFGTLFNRLAVDLLIEFDRRLAQEVGRIKRRPLFYI